MPGLGRVPAYPASPFGILARLGPLTRTVADGAAMLAVMAAPDRRDVANMGLAAPDYPAEAERGLRGLRIAFSATLGFVHGLSPEVRQACAGVAARDTALCLH